MAVKLYLCACDRADLNLVNADFFMPLLFCNAVYVTCF